MAWFVYMLECHDGSLYTGVSTDVARRFSVHVRGMGASYTRSHPPLRVVASWLCDGRSQALRLEYAIKALPLSAKLQWLAGSELAQKYRLRWPVLEEVDWVAARQTS